MIEGTRHIRTSDASMSTANAIPMASIFTVGSGFSTKLVNTTIMIAAAGRDDPGCRADPDRDGAVRVPGVKPGLVHPGWQETS